MLSVGSAGGRPDFDLPNPALGDTKRIGYFMGQNGIGWDDVVAICMLEDLVMFFLAGFL